MPFKFNLCRYNKASLEHDRAARDDRLKHLDSTLAITEAGLGDARRDAGQLRVTLGDERGRRERAEARCEELTKLVKEGTDGRFGP